MHFFYLHCAFFMLKHYICSARPRGGIGRHAILRGWCQQVCWFESSRGHKGKKSIAKESNTLFIFTKNSFYFAFESAIFIARKAKTLAINHFCILIHTGFAEKKVAAFAAVSTIIKLIVKLTPTCTIPSSKL